MVSLNSNITPPTDTQHKEQYINDVKCQLGVNNPSKISVSRNTFNHDKNDASSKPRYTYNEKINAISDYFGVSKAASKYMFNRRRRVFSHKKSDKKPVLTWSMQLQNAFIKADAIENFKWNTLNFDDDIKILKEYNINICDQSKTPIRNLNKINKKLKTDNDGEWTVVISNRKKINKKLLLKNIGFLL